MDHTLSAYMRSLGTSTAGYGVGDDSGTFGASQRTASVLADVIATANSEFLNDTLRTATLFDTYAGISAYAVWHHKPWKAAIDKYIRQRSGLGSSGVTNLETYLQYLNYGTGTKYQALMDGRAYRPWLYALTGAYPVVRNCYFEVLQGTLGVEAHLYSLGMGRFVVSGAGAGSFTAATLEGELVTNGSGFGMIDTTKYVPGIPHIIVSGLAGSGVVTVTGKGYKTDGTTESGVTWTATANASSSFALAVGTATAGSRPYEVTNIGIAAGITAGTIYVEARRNTTPATARILVSS